MLACSICCTCCSTPVTKRGAVIGGLIGFGFGVWASIDVVKPYAEHQGLSENMAIGVAFIVALLGGLEACVAAGLVVGAIAAPVIVSSMNYFGRLGQVFFVKQASNYLPQAPLKAEETPLLTSSV
jgi:hypothetical protein